MKARGRLLLCLSAIGGLIAATPAEAGVVQAGHGLPDRADRSFIYWDSIGAVTTTVELNQPNRVTVDVTPDRRTVVLKDRGQLIIPDPLSMTTLTQCLVVIDTATCTAPAGQYYIFGATLFLGGESDTATFSSIGSATGGPGDDLLVGGPGENWFDPGPGRDEIHVSDAEDRVTARDGEVDVIRCEGSNATVIADAVDELVDCPNADIG